MPEHGSQSWMWAPSEYAKRPRVEFPEFDPTTARGRLGAKKTTTTRVAHIQRTCRRRISPAVKRVIVSQLAIAKHRGPSPATFPHKPGKKRSLQHGDIVRFKPPLRATIRMAVGSVLCIPDREGNYVAVDRSAGQKKRRLLSAVEVVPVDDVYWPPSP